MSTTPYNEAGITATFAAIFARLEELEHGQEDHHTRLERLESARIAAPVAPESAETASGVPQEPGNATEALSEALRKAHDLAFNAECVVRRMRATDAEVLAALRMYRKVQGCRTAPNGDVIRPGAGNVLTAHILLAWLKEGEA